MNHRILRLLGACCVWVAVSNPAVAESFDAARKDVDGRLEASLRELAATRDRIAKEKIPLSKAVSALADEVIALRREHGRLLKLRDSRTIDFSSLGKQVDSLKGQEEFIDNRLKEFIHDFESRLDISEIPLFEERTGAARRAERDVNVDEDARREVQLAVVSAAVERLADQLGGRVFAGEALGPGGVLTSGSFVLVGPSSFFASGA